MKLNEAQSKAVSHVDGPMMVIAGPGSGKTTVITKRIKYLIEILGVAADILVQHNLHPSKPGKVCNAFVR